MESKVVMPLYYFLPGLLMIEICLIVDSSLRIILQYDIEHRLIVTIWTKKEVLSYSIAMAIFISFGIRGWELPEKLGMGVLAAYLLTASLIDIQTCEVYDFLHFIGTGAGFAFCLIRRLDIRLFLSIFIFWILQRFLFSRMYGMADARAFMVCALFLRGAGGGLLTYLLHMAAAFVVLGVIQGLRYNINRHGNLKEPVPFLPYISLTVWLFFQPDSF